MKRHHRLMAAMAAAGLFVAACGDAPDEPTDTPTGTEGPTATATAEPTEAAGGS